MAWYNLFSNKAVDQDELYDEAVAWVTQSRKASISSVQRHLRVGYNRAARIIEEMELLDASGKILDTWKLVPTKFFIDISTYSNGVYYLRIQTNKKSEVVKVLLQK